MTRPIYILIWNYSGSLDPDGSEARFASELRRHHPRVEVRADLQASDGDDAFLVPASDSPSPWMLALSDEHRASTLRRVFLWHGPKSPNHFKVLERYGLAGGVDALRNFTWSSARDTDSGFGVTGLRPVVEQVHGAVRPSPMTTSEHYAMYESPIATSLPQAIVEYLDVLGHMRDRGEID
jgi:hypothetical protein